MIRLLFAALLLCGPVRAEPRSGYADMSADTRAMQDDDTSNPAFLWVKQGEDIWTQDCASCHGAAATLRGVAQHYPAFDTKTNLPISLEQRIADHQGRKHNAEAVLALAALIGLQSRGLPMRANDDARLAPFVALGDQLFHRRQGQINLSCANCHSERAGEKLAGSPIPEGHANGYPQYRLEWQELGSFSRRLRSCLIGVRAEPYAPGSLEVVALELYLQTRSAGLKIETPAVRP